MSNLVKKDRYFPGDEIMFKSFFNDEPAIHGVIAEAHDCTKHMYYYIDYIDQSGRSMRGGMSGDDIIGMVQRREIDITPTMRELTQREKDLIEMHRK